MKSGSSTHRVIPFGLADYHPGDGPFDLSENGGHLIRLPARAKEQVHMLRHKDVSPQVEVEGLARPDDGLGQSEQRPLAREEGPSAIAGKGQFVGMARQIQAPASLPVLKGAHPTTVLYTGTPSGCPCHPSRISSCMKRASPRLPSVARSVSDNSRFTDRPCGAVHATPATVPARPAAPLSPTELELVEVAVEGGFLEEFGVGADVGDSALLHDHDLVGVFHGG